MINYSIQAHEVTFEFKEDINFETVRQLETKVREISLPETVSHLIINLQHVKFIDSTGVGFLISWIHPLTSRHRVTVINASIPVKNILQICKLDSLVEIA
ncbi:anti-anti-sigma factor [Aneurinibacillus soli]|uniref:STAS domain protein n=1 Tax=Aneurinibacillus soli TaxID=1500254 RepID=A0A0U5BM06_9BACL|nr:STAS domain-containing protein [Aneurinibacillus soli]PYE59456.1 anti-anti-sigma factor [Aneurinibacillus soli]BAU29214.1 STAS domain protein [Aneurinibacillus soli]